MSFLEIYLYGYIIAFILCIICHFKYPDIMTREHTVEDLKVSHLVGYTLVSLLSVGTVGIICITSLVDFLGYLFYKHKNKVLIKVKK